MSPRHASLAHVPRRLPNDCRMANTGCLSAHSKKCSTPWEYARKTGETIDSCQILRIKPYSQWKRQPKSSYHLICYKSEPKEDLHLFFRWHLPKLQAPFLAVAIGHWHDCICNGPSFSGGSGSTSYCLHLASNFCFSKVNLTAHL